MNIPILMYHEIVDEKPSRDLQEKVQGSYIVSRSKFKEQISCLKESGHYTVSLDEAINILKRKDKTNEKPIVITFDDGFEGNYRYALPILMEYGLSATFFVSAGLVGNSNMLSWDQIREMDSMGMSIQSHSVSHPMLSTLESEKLKYELLESKLMIEEKIGTPVNFFSYPNGDYNSEVILNLRNLGYRAACSSKFGLNKSETNIFELKRIKIPGSYNLEEFKKILFLDRKKYLLLHSKDLLLSSFRRIIGPNNYEKIYSKLHNIKQ